MTRQDRSVSGKNMKRSRQDPVIAIDGPAASGKTTVAKKVANILGYAWVDTGALYRCLAWLARAQSVDENDENRLSELASDLKVRFEPGPDRLTVWLADDDVTESIREPAISQLASRISAFPKVRKALLAIQQTLGQAGRVVLEGRDIGTVVFPDAEIKVFLQAAPGVRAKRRFTELSTKGIQVNLEATLDELQRRDQRDTSRTVAPLKPARDAVIIDTGKLSADQVAQWVVELVRRFTSGQLEDL